MDKNMEGIQDEPGVWLPSSHSSGTHDLFGDPEISPRVGDEYQVELPPLMTKDELRQLMEDPVHLGLPIPVVWVLDQSESINREPANPDAAVHVPGLVDSESSEENHSTVNSEDANGKVKSLSSALDDGEQIAGDSMDIDLVSPQEKSSSLDRGYEGCLPVPGLSGEAWKDIERDGFLLGLYIFGKNLCLVKKFVGSKGMGEILSYYHGKFYKSSEYNRWLECRKKRKKRCSYGERIFTSWRQQELMSRLSSHVSEECKTRLIEASRIFGEGKMSLEEYVLALKDMVGLKVLVQAVAIGKGKRDLTGLPMGDAKTNPALPARPEIPRGSSLTVDEIVKFLTGDVRLSKARSNDLFWDAVWPRLLDNGWRTEEPINYVPLTSKYPWVYIIPGVKKFSRRKLVKGTHYFDTITDVLNKVAMEPKLLEFKPVTAKVSICKDEEGSGPGSHAAKETDGFSSRERHSYLQPRVFQEHMKFTIVDTSLVCGKETTKVIEQRTLPADPVAISTPPAVSGGIKQKAGEESQSVVQENDIVNGVEDVMESKQSVDTPSCEASMVLNNHSPSSPDPMISATDKFEEQKQLRVPMKFKFSRKVKSSQPNDVASLTPCDNKGGSSNGFKDICSDTELNGGESLSFSSHNVEYNTPQAETLEHSPMEKTEDTWIDLNHLPHTPPDSDRDDEPLVKKLSETSQQPELPNPSGTVARTGKHQVVSGQRQSTRNRPLTTKALEAFACGYLSPKKNKRKSVEKETAASQDNAEPEPKPKPPRRVRAKTALLTRCGGSIGDEAALNKMEKGVDGVFKGSSHMVSTSRK